MAGGRRESVFRSQRTIEIGAIHDREDPDFTLRVLGSMAPLPEGTPEPLWKKRNKVPNGQRLRAGATTGAKLVPPDKYGPTHPEYFALVDGSQGAGLELPTTVSTATNSVRPTPRSFGSR